LGLTKNDYKIDKPKIRRHDNLTGADGTIKVEVLVNNCEYFPHQNVS
jgi:phage antirepressor YoqD-like protein